MSVSAGDLVIILLVNGTFSVSRVGRTHPRKHVGTVRSRREAVELAWGHRDGGRIWFVEGAGSLVALNGPPDIDGT